MATNDAGIFSLNWKDVGKATLMLFITTVVSGLIQGIEAGAFPTWVQIKSSLLVGATAAVAYFLKNFLTNNEDKFLTKDNPVK